MYPETGHKLSTDNFGVFPFVLFRLATNQWSMTLHQKSISQKLWALLQLGLVYGFVFNPYTTFPYTFIIIILSISVLVYAYDGSLKSIGIQFHNVGYKTVVRALLIFAFAAPLLDLLIQPLLNKCTGEVADYSAFEALAGNVGKYLKYVLYVLISAAIGEEILFRGFVFRQLQILLPQGRWSTKFTIVISAVLFSLPHLYQGISGLIMTFIFGLLFAIVYVKSKHNLWVSIILHALIDLMFLTLAYFDKLSYYTLGNDFIFGY